MNIETVRNWYNNTYKTLGNKWGAPEEAYDDFMKHLSISLDVFWKFSTYKLLDIACGNGILLKRASEAGLQIYGIDISDEAIKLAKETCPEAKVYLMQAENLEFNDNSFNFITCIGSLEHFLDIDKSLQEMYRVGKPWCRYCILVPNGSSIFKNKTDQQEINEHILSYNQWIKKFKNNNFRIDKIYKDMWHVKKPQSFIMKILNLIAPKRISNSLIFILGKNYEINY